MRVLTRLLLALAACLLAPAALAQAWPGKQPIKLVAVFPPGGSVDQVARILAPVLQQRLGQAVVAQKLAAQGIVTNTDTPAAAQAFIERQLDTWAQVVKANGIKAD